MRSVQNTLLLPQNCVCTYVIFPFNESFLCLYHNSTVQSSLSAGTWSWTTYYWMQRVTVNWRTSGCARRESSTESRPPPSVGRQITSHPRWPQKHSVYEFGLKQILLKPQVWSLWMCGCVSNSRVVMLCFLVAWFIVMFDSLQTTLCFI